MLELTESLQIAWLRSIQQICKNTEEVLLNMLDEILKQGW